MKNVSHRKKWTAEVVEQHIYPPAIPLIKSNQDNSSEKYFVKLKLRRDLTSDKSDLYEFKMVLFDNGDPE